MPKFSESYVRNLQVEEGKREIVRFDEGPDAIRGFYIRKQRSGDASYGVKFTVNGKSQRYILGKAVAGNLKDMRRRADEVRAHARQGKDPLAAQAFQDDADLVFGGEVPPRGSPDVPDRLLRALWSLLVALSHRVPPRGYDEPQSLSYAINSIRPVGPDGEQVQLLDGIAKQNGPIAAARVKASLTTLFKWLLDRGHIITFPAMSLPSSGESKETRPLTEAELLAVWHACRDDDYGHLVRLGILTALRRLNLGDLRWSDFDLQQRQLTIPGERMKNRRDFILPLSDPAVAILRSIERRGEFVFGEVPGSGFSGWSKAKRALDKRINAARALRGEGAMPPWKLHGLRATFATLMNERDLAPPHIIDELLAHVGPHKASVAGRYNQAAYAEQKRKAMEEWGQLVAQIVGGSASSPATEPLDLSDRGIDCVI